MSAWSLLCVPVVLLIVLFVVPTVWALWISAHDYSHNLLQPDWVSMGNYLRLFHTGSFWQSLGITLVFTALTLPAMIWLPIPLALLLQQPLKGIQVYRVIAYLPVISPLVAMAITWKGLYASDGVFNTVLSALHLPAVPWLTSPDVALLAIIMMVVWKGLAYYGMMVLTQLLQLDPQLNEAARLDGAGPWQVFWQVTYPGLQPVLGVVGLICLLGCFKSFTEQYVMTRGGPMDSTTTWLYWIYHHGFERLDLGLACAGGLLLMVVLGALALLQQRVQSLQQAD
jgi:putative chitobiose transport system permease protein